MSASNGWERQFAIMMPNGELFSSAAETEMAEDYSIPGPVRDMFAIVGVHTPKPPQPFGPLIFPTRAAAETKLDELRKRAEEFGVTLWGGSVVERLCTPFVAADPEAQFRNAIISWLQQQQGDA